MSDWYKKINKTWGIYQGSTQLQNGKVQIIDYCKRCDTISSSVTVKKQDSMGI